MRSALGPSPAASASCWGTSPFVGAVQGQLCVFVRLRAAYVYLVQRTKVWACQKGESTIPQTEMGRPRQLLRVRTAWHLLWGSRLARGAAPGFWLNGGESLPCQWLCKALKQAEIQISLTWGLYQDFKAVPAPALSRIFVSGQMRVRKKYGMHTTLTPDSAQHDSVQEFSPPAPSRDSMPPPRAPEALPACHDRGTYGTPQHGSLSVPLSFHCLPVSPRRAMSDSYPKSQSQ